MNNWIHFFKVLAVKCSELLKSDRQPLHACHMCSRSQWACKAASITITQIKLLWQWNSKSDFAGPQQRQECCWPLSEHFSRKDFYISKISSFLSDPKSTWGRLNNLKLLSTWITAQQVRRGARTSCIRFYPSTMGRERLKVNTLHGFSHIWHIVNCFLLSLI